MNFTKQEPAKAFFTSSFLHSDVVLNKPLTYHHCFFNPAKNRVALVFQLTSIISFQNNHE